jgi:hypothetical protein
MELKTARLTLLIDPNKKAAFEQLCSQLDLTPSQVVRQLIRDYLVEHGVTFTPSGEAVHDARSAEAPGGSPRAGQPAKPLRGPAKSARSAKSAKS